MKKSIHSLLSKLNETVDGKLSGGFGQIKGGGGSLPAYNDNCTNPGTCSGTNIHVCTNTGDCSWSTNQNGGCTNSRDCFF